MAKNPPGWRWLSVVALVALTLTLVSLAVAVSMQSASMWLEFTGRRDPEVLLVSGLHVLAFVSGGLVAMLLYGLLNRFLQDVPTRQGISDRLNRIESVLQAMHESDRRLIDLAQMSDAAKSLLFRQREIEAMNELLHDYLVGQQYEQAEGLVSDVQKRLGYSDEVTRMRNEIATARSSTSEQKIDQAVERVKKYLTSHDWTIAKRMVQRLLKTMGENPKIRALPEMVREAQTNHKRDLLKTYGEAVKNGDVDKSIELLRELDKYLTPQEGAALEESARGMFRAKLHNLGVQFAIRVTEEQWADALSIGRQIVAEYPNSRMAQEVQLKLETLQSLASGNAPAQAGEVG